VSIAGSNRSAISDESGLAIFQLAPGEYFVDAQLCCRGPRGIDFHVPVSVAAAETVEITLEGCSLCVCAAPDTPVATPWGEVPMYSLATGDLVLSIHHGQITAVPVLETNRVAVNHHRVVRVELANGKVLEMSPGHPTADGRFFGDLRAGDTLGATAILSTGLVPYAASHTYDILPASDSGVYFAGGVPIGSTLHRFGSRAVGSTPLP
jgi:hypothetical protein